MADKKLPFRGVYKTPTREEYRATVEIFGKTYRSDAFPDAVSAAILYDALCVVLHRESRRNYPGRPITGGFLRQAREIYRRARKENPEAVRKERSRKAIESRIKPYERSEREIAIIEAASTAGMQHAAAHPDLPLVDPELQAAVLAVKLKVQNPTAAPRLMMLQFPWRTTLADRQLYWRSFARGARKIVLNRQRRGATPEEAAQIAASF